ncbi:YbaB/EbfC family nucleoid-associated protein [Nocardia puris]|uniref:YbaB/EbfC DNA-binding family protein n=1 Tax=Nocardia puris TaxID=208602 RepID=A0A366DWC5_9NOCA|nr:YbaB/EbfC family nucleoid-associated protein [Nocardia puris]MBF6210404.1 YbaB/EbfC family nucleoid-associated protein [Nocardia puris]MBF6367479.1 YbaB/EbfC family nucleoid-associated protein [Nocardia puris]MBF6457664.1 YbaB/EbfC family nucleoid-associated protein [Nocardia puris]RBO93829.1 YbaB/EbfC DNA-binding family protein [Nocardia puris]
MLSNDPAQAADDLARWAENLQRTAEKYQELHGRMAAVSVTETSADNRISVTVDANGVTTAISLAPATRGMDPAAVASELMACTKRAQAKLRVQVTDMVHAAVGDDAAGQSIVGQYAERFPDVAPEAPAAPPTPPEPEYTPPAAFTPPPPAAPAPGTRKPDRDHTVTPDEPDDDDLYYRRKSWLE